jgi:hypothetical protein
MVACIDFFEMSEICRPKFIVRHSMYGWLQKKTGTVRKSSVRFYYYFYSLKRLFRI